MDSAKKVAEFYIASDEQRTEDSTGGHTMDPNVVEKVTDLCIQLKDLWVKPLNKVFKQDIRDVVQRVAQTVRTEKDLFDRVAIELGDMQMQHPQFGGLAARMLLSQLYMETPSTFHSAMRCLHNSLILSEETWKACCRYKTKIFKLLKKHEHSDFDNITYQGVNHLKKSYLIRSLDDKIVERPRYMFMRVALGLNPNNFDLAAKTFETLVDGTLAMASPIMFNAGTKSPQMASCFIQTVNGSPPQNKYVDLAETAAISNMGGGVGINIDGSDTDLFHIVVDRTIKDMPQGGAKNPKRPGAGAVYREPWETDFLKILANKRTEGGREDEKHKDLFLAMWTPSLFVRRVKESLRTGEPVMLSCFDGPCAEELREVHGKVFDDLYAKYELSRLYKKQVPVLKVMEAVCMTYKETGVPYTLFKDICNRRSNHNNRGTLRGSNLCAEILEYSDKNETAVCTLASICVSKFLVKASDTDVEYDFDKLGEVARLAVRNLNSTIDLNLYPSDKTRLSHTKMRPLGIGIRDLQGLFIGAGLPFTSANAKRLMDRVMATIYYHALDESRLMAVEAGRPYAYFEGSMYSKGILQQATTEFQPDFKCSICDYGECNFCSVKIHFPEEPLDWDKLAKEIVRDGLYNSLVTAIMPTVGTAQIFGNYESAEPLHSLVFLSRVNSGSFQVVCSQLVEDLEKEGLWIPLIKNKIVSDGGSIQGIDGIPTRIKAIYKTVWEISQKERMKMAATMGRYVDQGISFNIYLVDPTNAKYVSLMLYSHDHCDMKINNYYQRSQAGSNAKKLVVDAQIAAEEDKLKKSKKVCDASVCLACTV